MSSEPMERELHLAQLVVKSVDDATIDQVCAMIRERLGVDEVFLECGGMAAALESSGAAAALQNVGSFGVLVARSRQPHVFSDTDISFMASMADILANGIERCRADRERERLTRGLQLLLDSTVEGILTLDLHGRCATASAAAAQMLGRDVTSLSGHDARMLLFGVPDIDTPILEVASTRKAWSAQDSFVRADGSSFPVQVSAGPIIDNGEAVGVVVGFTDITDRLKLEAKLEQANRISSLGRLAATIAHEFNNVLMGIAPFVDVMRRGKNLEASLDHIGRAVARGRRITQDILRFTQPAQPSLVALDVEPWLQGIAVEARSLLSSQCTIEVKPCAEPLHIDGDPNQLQQIFTNLILNARDAMPLGGRVTIEARREDANAKLPLAVAHPERFAHLLVRDTGCGMNEEMLCHVFEPLFTTKRNGTGLGLPVALQVVQRHGGEMFVESAPSFGTTFHLFLPLAAAPAASDVKPDIAHATVASSTTVLLVEDDATVASGIVSLLELEGMTVHVAATGKEALSTFRRKVPDVVILDVGLPDIDGVDLYAEIARTLRDLPVIFSTGHADRRKLDALLTNAHVGFLLKPYDGAALLKAMTTVMAPARAA